MKGHNTLKARYTSPKDRSCEKSHQTSCALKPHDVGQVLTARENRVACKQEALQVFRYQMQQEVAEVDQVHEEVGSFVRFAHLTPQRQTKQEAKAQALKAAQYTHNTKARL